MVGAGLRGLTGFSKLAMAAHGKALRSPLYLDTHPGRLNMGLPLEVRSPIKDIHGGGAAKAFEAERAPVSGDKVLAKLEYATNGNHIVAATKPSMQERVVETHRYVNPGHHDPYLKQADRSVPYNPIKSVLPKNHRELFLASKPFVNGDGEVTRFAQDEQGQIHRFQSTGQGVYHWNGSTNSRTLNAEPVKLDLKSDARRFLDEQFGYR
jgi:hypothetical protein